MSLQINVHNKGIAAALCLLVHSVAWVEQGGGAEDELDNEEQTDEHITDEGETEAGGWLVDDSEEREILCLCRR